MASVGFVAEPRGRWAGNWVFPVVVLLLSLCGCAVFPLRHSSVRHERPGSAIWDPIGWRRAFWDTTTVEEYVGAGFVMAGSM